jgi:PH (Pleckstrin Homology) domain-containing protein
VVDYFIENELTPALGQGEKLLWAGKPKTGVVFRNSDFFLIPFSLLWGGFAFFWEFTVLGSGGPTFFSLFGLPFVVVGLYITIGRFFIDAYKRAHTLYGITEERVIIKSGILSSSITSVNIKALQGLTFSQKADGSGTIVLGNIDSRYAMMQGMDWPSVKQPPKLDLIEDVKAVYDQIVGLQRTKSERS